MGGGAGIGLAMILGWLIVTYAAGFFMVVHGHLAP
jgi:hypothetical protein